MNDFVFRQSHGLKFMVCEPLENLGFINAFSTRLIEDENSSEEFTLGHSNPEKFEEISQNRRRFKTSIGAENFTLVTARQIHSADIRAIEDETDAQGEPQPGDALTANLAQVLLGIQTADCLPILIVDERTQAFAGIHAGWRGTFQEIASSTIEWMKIKFGSRPHDLHAALGPAIGAENFEVGPEVIEQFRRKFPYAEQLISKKQANGKGHIDLNRCNINQMLGSGLSEKNIYDSALCTIDRNDLFFSYRKERGHENPVGRLMSVVGRK